MTIREALEAGLREYGNVPIKRTKFGKVTYHTFETVDQAYNYLRADVLDVIEKDIIPGETLDVNVVGTLFSVKKITDIAGGLLYATGR